MRVLICDDEPSIRLLFRTAVEQLGGDVLEASDGVECLALASGIQPDVVILDLMMPKPDGLGVLPELVAACPGAEILVVSAHANRETFAEALAAGATAAFEKLSFLDRIPQIFERRQLTA